MSSPEADRIKHIKRMRQYGHKYFRERSEVYRKFVEMEAVAFRDGALSKREKELIAIGISIVTDCESCLEWHIREAIEAGADEAQVVEAIGVGLEMGVGPTTVTARFAAAVLEELLRPA
jgi:AhpD family alkylhydroperoxidase